MKKENIKKSDMEKKENYSLLMNDGRFVKMKNGTIGRTLPFVVSVFTTLSEEQLRLLETGKYYAVTVSKLEYNKAIELLEIGTSKLHYNGMAKGIINSFFYEISK